VSVAGSGRAGVLALGGTVVERLALRRWRSTPELLCTPGPVSRRATRARLVRAPRAGDDRVVVGLDTSAGRAVDSVGPAAALGGGLTDALGSGLADLLGWFGLGVEGVATRAVDDPDGPAALALGLRFAGVAEDRAAWDGFDRSLLGDADWSFTLDADVLARRLRDRFAARATQLGATLYPGSPRVEWGDWITVFATGDFTVPGYGAHNFVLVVRYRFVLGGGRLRVHRSPLAAGEASADRPGWSSDYGVETFGGDLAAAAFDAATDPDALFPPIRLAFDLAGGRFTTRALRHGTRTLRVAGDAEVPDEVVAPRLTVDRRRRSFYQEAFSQCRDDGAPTFTLQRVELRAGPGGVRLCGVTVEGDEGFRILTVDLDRFHPAPDGRSLAEPPVEMAPDSVVSLVLGYVGDRAEAAAGELRIVSTDPHALLRTVPLRVVAGGRAAAELHPPALDVVVGNAPDGRRATLGSACFPIETTPAPPDPNAPDARLVLTNTGEAPLGVCQVRVEHDPADPDSRFAFDASWSDNYVVPPGGTGTVEIRFYPRRPRQRDPRDLTPPVSDHVYRATVVVELGGALRGHPVTAQVTGRVEPRPVVREVPGRSGRVRAGFDPGRDAVCVPKPDIDLCDLEPFFEPIGPSEAFVVADLRVRGLADDASVTLADHGGTVVVRDLGRGPDRRLDVGLGAAGRSGPCIPRVDGGPQPRLELCHAVVRPGPSAVIPDPRCVLDHTGHTWVGTGSGLVVLDAEGRTADHELPVGRVEGLAVAAGLVWAAVGDRLVAVDPSRPAAVVTEIGIGARVSAVAATPTGLVVAAGAVLRAVGTDGATVGPVVGLPEPARWVFAVPRGVVAVGEKSIALVDGASSRPAVHTPTFPIMAAGAVGSRVLVHGRETSAALAADAAGVHAVAEYRSRHWRAAFAPEPRGTLHTLTAQGVRRWELARRRLDAAALPEAFVPRLERIRPSAASDADG